MKLSEFNGRLDFLWIEDELGDGCTSLVRHCALKHQSSWRVQRQRSTYELMRSFSVMEKMVSRHF
ncbi:unnamed protein product [Arabis nemorensis]|uniref:Uncharacterized protein n=1 Tax=Arabis nemorensis TaxID=586526 RepID=A0A565BS16_9BRAS|nr:unnamed protein product [Arabis nemorensis]